MTANEVHEAAGAVLRFWLEETPPELRFAKDDGLDAAIRDRFGDLRERVAATRTTGWDAAPESLLAAVIVLDQFSRNLFRGSGRAFEADTVARSLTRTAMRNGWDTGMSGEERVFLYMPLMHSEEAGDQLDSVGAFTALGIEDNLKYARAHRDVIAQFGRFPSRNAALGRTSTPAEEEYLSRPGAGW